MDREKNNEFGAALAVPLVPSRWRFARSIGLATCVVGLAITSGCGLFRSSGDEYDYGDDEEVTSVTTRPATTQESWSSVQPLPQALQPGNRPVVQDQLPLIYLVESDVNIRVSNVTTGEEIVTFPARATQIVRVESKGVLLANKPVLGASLAPGTYAIEVLPPGATAGTVQARQTITRPIPAAATRPAARPQPAPAPRPAPAPPAPAPEPAPDAAAEPTTPPTQ